MSGWPNYPGPMDYGQDKPDQFRPNMGHEAYNGPHNEEQPIIDYLETRFDQDPHYNDPTDPDDYQDFEPEFDVDDDGCEPETYHDDAGDGTETEII